MSSRSIEVIYNELVESVASQAGSSWSALKDSMVGKELLYAGANIISATEMISESINGVLDVSRYGMDQLIAYAYTQDVSLDLGRPSSIKLRFSGDFADRNVVCAPFSLCIQIGTLSFYNIDYCTSGGDVLLYCGQPYKMVSRQGGDLSLPFLVNGALSQAWRLFLELKGGSYQSSYVKLGSDVVSESVWVFARKHLSDSAVSAGEVSPTFPYTSYDAALSDPQAKLYKVRTLWDYTACVLFGDGNWAQEVAPTIYDYEVVWLRGAYGRFTVTSGVSLSYTGFDGRVETFTQRAGQASRFEILSTTNGQSMLVSYARNYVVSQVFRQQGLVTETQLRNFVLSYPSVQSAFLAVSSGLVDIYVKPVVQGDDAFGFLEDYLYQYGVSGVHYRVHVADAVEFMVRLRAVSQTGYQSLSRAASILSQEYSYDSVTMSTLVSTALLQQELQLQGVSDVLVSLYGHDRLTGSDSGEYRMRALPISGSIRQYSADGLLLGFDSEGRYKAYVSLLSDTYGLSSATVSFVGDFYWLSAGVGKSYLGSLLSDGRLAFTDCSVAFGDSMPAGSRFIPYSDGLFGIESGSGSSTQVRLYRASSLFEAGDGSLFEHPSYVSTVPNSGVVFGIDSVDSSVSLLRVLGVRGHNDNPDVLVCAVKVARGGSVVYGLASYRLSQSSTYVFDLMLMYATTTESLVLCSSYYGGRWFMPLSTANGSVAGSSFLGIGVFDDTAYGSYTNSGDVSAWTKVYSLVPLSDSSVVLQLEGTELIDMRIVSDSEAWVLYKVVDSDVVRYYVAYMTYMLVTTDTGNSEFRYSFIPIAGSTSGSSALLIEGDGVPVGIGSASSDFISLYGELAGSNVFWGLRDGDLVQHSVVGSSFVGVRGSVDYSSGVISGLVASDGDFLEYGLASVLGGGASYPLLREDGIIVE